MGRLIVIFAAYFGALGALPACSQTADDTPPRAVAQETEALFATLAQMELSAQPELTTHLGLPSGFLDPRQNMVLGDRSQAAFERLRLRRIEVLKYLKALPLAPEGSRLRRDQEAVLRAYASAVDVAEFGHGWIGLGDAYPYVMDHRRGAWIDIPDMLIHRQTVDSALTASDYISRLTALAGALDDERLRLMADADVGIVPPDTIVLKLSQRLIEFLERPTDTQPVIANFNARLAEIEDLSDQARLDLMAEARVAMEERVLPAYRRLAATVGDLALKTGDIPGVWAFAEGDEYYDALLAMHLSPGVSAESLHLQARARVDELNEALDAELTFLGWTEGSVGDRLAVLADDPFQTFDATPEGRLELETVLEAQLALTERFDGWIARRPDLPIELDAVDASPGYARYIPPPANRSAPGRLRMDTLDVTAWPRFSLAALVLHETVPGHHLEASFAMDTARMPLIRQLIWNTGYGEGWASYAETLALDARLYDDDPYARVGILQSQLYHAARAVADTGIHRMRWTRAETVDYLIATTGMSRGTLEETVDRIIVWPGQACTYMAGSLVIEDLRARAEAVIGPNFDVAAFHYTLLEGGPRPLVQVRADLERWYEAQFRTNN